MKNIDDKEDEETWIMRLRFEEVLILQTLEAFTKQNIEESEKERESDEAEKRSNKNRHWQSKQNIGETPWWH